jgi:hypothetical protein
MRERRIRCSHVSGASSLVLPCQVRDGDRQPPVLQGVGSTAVREENMFMPRSKHQNALPRCYPAQ